MQLIVGFIVVVMLITAIKMIKDGKHLGKALFKKEYKISKAALVASQLKKYNGHSKVITKGNIVAFITEYYVFIGLVIDEAGMLLGSETSDYFVLKYGGSEKSIKNEIPYFNELVSKISSNMDGIPINKYIIVGSSTMITFNISTISMLRVSDVYYNFIRKDGKINYTPSDINRIAKIIENSLM